MTMKAGKLAIWPWLSCRYTKNTLMDEPCLHSILNCVSLLEISKLLLQPFEIGKINNYMADKGQFYLMQNYAFSPKECTLRNKHPLLPGDVRKQCCKTPLYCH